MIKESSALTDKGGANFDGLIAISEIIRDSLGE
jgi:flagellar biosynthesis regulator FlaF